MKPSEALDRHPEKLRAVVVLDEADPSLTCPAPADWVRLGVRGIRLNLIGKSAPDLRSSAWTEYIAETGRLGWHLEFQVEASGRYRSPSSCAGTFANTLIGRGFDRLVFGSDWPRTRFEVGAGTAWEWALRPELQPTG